MRSARDTEGGSNQAAARRPGAHIQRPGRLDGPRSVLALQRRAGNRADDLLAASDLGFQSVLVHLLTERWSLSNYSRRIGIPEDSPGGFSDAEFRRARGRGIVAETAERDAERTRQQIERERLNGATEHLEGERRVPAP